MDGLVGGYRISETKLICTVIGTSAQAILESASQIHEDSRVWVELRLDGLPESDLRSMALQTAGVGSPIIVTCRSVSQGGRSTLGLKDAAALLSQLGADFIDVEFNTDATTSLDQPDVSMGARANANILSYHDFRAIPSDLDSLIGTMERHPRKPVAVKIAWRCGDICENIRALVLLRSKPWKRLLICMGERGLMSRILAAKAKAFGTFCAANADQIAAPGQVSLEKMLGLYRWRSIDERTKFFGVIGSPVRHSLSPVLFNTQFEHHGLNGVYLPLLVETEGELKRFLDACRENPWLDATGFSVTIPHKEAVCQWLGSKADEHARRIGAVNTIHLKEGEYFGFNTDYQGVLGALRAKGGIALDDLGSCRATVLGAGGVARAAVTALTDSGVSVTIFNRSAQRAECLAAEFDCSHGPWEDRAADVPDLIINCTSVGMWPNVDAVPFPIESLQSATLVFDTVYRPQETKLIRAAREAGCKTVEGLEMFIHQAAAQYQIWTGRTADLSLFRHAAEQALSEDDTPDAGGQR